MTQQTPVTRVLIEFDSTGKEIKRETSTVIDRVARREEAAK